jgi:OFA family oxalate/formate antiporter-like MFS transporter
MNVNNSRGELRTHWRALLGCALAASMGTVGLHAYTSGAFVSAMVEQAGYTREQMSLATLFLSATCAVTVPLAAMLMDRFGALRIITFAVIGEAFGFALLGAMPEVFEAYAAGVVILAVLGVGTTPPGFARIVASRFDRKRGLALGLMISGLAITAITAPSWATWIVNAAGWRAGYWVLAALVLLLGLSGVWLIRSDERHAARNAHTTAHPARTSKGDWSALRQPLFWLLLIGFLAPGFFSGGYLLHLISLLKDRGFTPAEAAQIQGLMGFTIFIGRIASGAALDRFRAQYVAAVAFTISGLGCALLLTSNPLLVSIASLAIGLTIGAELDIMAYVIARYFGLDSFGRLYGLAYAGLIVASGASPLMIAMVASDGGYSSALVVSSIGTILGAVILLCIQSNQPHVSAATAPAR